MGITKDVSQGSVATYAKWGGIHNNRFTANSLEIYSVKGF